MFVPSGRSAVRLALCALRSLRAPLAAFLIFTTYGAHAVIVRGTVTDPLGQRIAGAHVQLVEGPTVVASAVSNPDGTYEIRSTAAGRFTLLTSTAQFFPAIGENFYGGATDVISQNPVLESSSLHQEVTVTATGVPTPLQRTSAAVSLIPNAALTTSIDLIDAMRQSPGIDLVQTGQYGGITSLFIRGGNSTANQILIDGIPAEDVGGTFDFGDVSATGLNFGGETSTAVEFYRGPNSALFGTNAGAGVVYLSTPRGTGTQPVLNYTGEAGNLHTYRNEASVSGTLQRLDYFVTGSRFDTSNALQRDEYHSITEAANIGYSVLANTNIRFTIRNADSAAGLPGAHDFYGISASGKQADQDIYSGLTVENRTSKNWHNLARYGIARKREQEVQFTNVGTPVTYNFGTVPCSNPASDCFTEYFGNSVTIRGANGYQATGRASFFIPADKLDSNRDELFYQSDYSFGHLLTALFGFRYENERGSYVSAFDNEKIKRPNYEYTLQLQGEAFGRLFYSAGGGIEKNHLYGITGTPRFGLSYAPVRPGPRFFDGTLLRANVATGVQEPTLGIQFASLYTQLQQAGDTADIAKYHVTPAGPQKSRTLDVGIDQNILGQKLIVKAGYYHNAFTHQLEGVDAGALEQIFGYSPSLVQNVFTPYLNSLAFRAQGFEGELQWQALKRVFVRGGYTYLDAKVTQSFSSDAYSNGTYNNNPSLPKTPIGAEGPLIGGRPFRRPPNSGFASVQYTGTKFSTALKAAMASRADDSTFLDGFDPNFGNSLVLPNRDLDFGYVKLDGNLTYAATKRVTVFAQLNNLLNDQHIGPIGYPGLPFTVRAGLKIRLGGD
jgi:iron complex outermembrane receptor protein/vitamin B12 transporter